MHIELGDDGRYSAIGIGTITFQRQSGKPFQLKYVMNVPGLKKNLVSVAMLEDRGKMLLVKEKLPTTQNNKKILEDRDSS